MKKNYTVLFLVLFFVLGLLIYKNIAKQDTEIDKIKITNDITVQSDLYRDLIYRIGPVNAQNELFKSGLPFTGQTHLLNHTVGNFLYEKYGKSGLVYCKDYFLSSCYHGLILNVIASEGMSGVVQTFDECLKYDRVISDQCSHAIGHGLLVNLGYKNLIKALETCEEIGTKSEKFPTFNCYDGVFMENIWAIHDGSESKDRWVKESDPMYPCNDLRLNSKYLLACWSNQPALSFQLLKGDLSKVSNVCMDIKESDYKKMCFDGLSRQIHPLAKGSVSKTFELCNLIPNDEWSNYCLSVNANSSYAVGDKSIPFSICNSVVQSFQEKCYLSLFENMVIYSKTDHDFRRACSGVLDKEWKSKCLDFRKNI